MKSFLRTLFVFGFVIGSGWLVWAEGGASQPLPQAEVGESVFDFGQVNEGDVVTHDFSIRNRGAAALEITKVDPG